MAFDAAAQAYFDRFQPADNFELALVEEMAAASWHLRRAFAMETNMLDTEMDACPAAGTQLDRLTSAFGNLAGTPKLNTIHRYQTRLAFITGIPAPSAILFSSANPSRRPPRRSRIPIPNPPALPFCPLHPYQTNPQPPFPSTNPSPTNPLANPAANPVLPSNPFPPVIS
jgi:hypothetical protein